MDSRICEAFGDELQKISGEMTGATRIGRKPISVEKMLENEATVTGLPEEFVQQTMAKAASAFLKVSKVSGKTLAAVGAGAVGALTARQANEDRKLGRMVRKQQQ
jgi:hypothetical protein